MQHRLSSTKKRQKSSPLLKIAEPKHTVVVRLVVISVGCTDTVTGCSGVELITHAEIWTQSVLHSRLASSDGDTACDRDIVDDFLQRVIALDGGRRAGS